MVSCRVTFGLVCLVTVVGGICVMALQIVTATTRAWVSVSVQQSSLSFGIFSQKASISVVTLTMLRTSGLVCLQAMLVFSVGFGATAVIATMIGGTQRQICGRGTYFYVRIADICFVLSAITSLVGIAVFTHFWIKEPQKFFHPTPIGASYYYGYAYMLGWFVFFLQTALAVFAIIGIHVIVRKHDKELLEDDDSTNERRKLVATRRTEQTKNDSEHSSSKIFPSQTDESISVVSEKAAEGSTSSSGDVPDASVPKQGTEE